MTSVPKPLKFLRPHYQVLKDLFEKWGAGQEKVSFVLCPEECPEESMLFASRAFLYIGWVCCVMVCFNIYEFFDIKEMRNHLTR